MNDCNKTLFHCILDKLFLFLFHFILFRKELYFLNLEHIGRFREQRIHDTGYRTQGRIQIMLQDTGADTVGYMNIQEDTEGYRRKQEDTGEYRRIQENIGGYRRIHVDTGGYRRIQENTGEYRLIQKGTGYSIQGRIQNVLQETEVDTVG